MRTPLRHRRRELSAFADVVVAVVSYTVILLWHVGFDQGSLATWYNLQIPIIIVLWWLLSALFRQDVSYRMGGAVSEILETCSINVVGGFVLLAVEALSGYAHVSRLVMVAFPVLSCASSLAYRIALRAAIAAWRAGGGNDVKHLLIVGPAAAGWDVALNLCRPASGLDLVGLIVPPDEGCAPDLSTYCLGDYASLSGVLHDRVVDHVVVVAPITDAGGREAIETATVEGKTVWLRLDSFGAKMLGHTPGHLLMISPWKDPLRLSIKRVVDLAVSAMALVLVAPVLAACALAIKAEDPNAPVLFRQPRIGLHGRLFSCYKLRTMVPGAEGRRTALLAHNEMNGPVFKMAHDPRVTTVGSWLRRYSLDELPQFWNVLTGEMSLVGPRPPLPEEVLAYDDEFRRRLAFRPGLTCLWQISGRNRVGFEDWMTLDLRYVDTWSLGLDLKILLRTIPAVLSGTGC